jgi:hypothetical protein
MDFLEKQKTLRLIQETNPGLVGLLTQEEIDDIHEALQNGEDIQNLVGAAEKATFRAAASDVKEEGDIQDESSEAEDEPVPAVEEAVSEVKSEEVVPGEVVEEIETVEKVEEVEKEEVPEIEEGVKEEEENKEQE